MRWSGRGCRSPTPSPITRALHIASMRPGLQNHWDRSPEPSPGLRIMAYSSPAPGHVRPLCAGALCVMPAWVWRDVGRALAERWPSARLRCPARSTTGDSAAARMCTCMHVHQVEPLDVPRPRRRQRSQQQPYDSRVRCGRGCQWRGGASGCRRGCRLTPHIPIRTYVDIYFDLHMHTHKYADVYMPFRPVSEAPCFLDPLTGVSARCGGKEDTKWLTAGPMRVRGALRKALPGVGCTGLRKPARASCWMPFAGMSSPVG